MPHTVHVTYQGVSATLLADPDYDEEDWDLAVRELVARGYVPASEHNEVAAVTPAGYEIYSWVKLPAPVPAPRPKPAVEAHAEAAPLDYAL